MPIVPINWKAALDEVVGKLAVELVGLRRHLHAHPEPSGEELHTSLHLYQLLGKLGLDVHLGPDGCGLTADSLPADSASPRCIAIRADLDALHIQDEKHVDYRSTRAGVMHACGHDAHTAIVYGAAKALVTLAKHNRLPWPVRWRVILQPAEETAAGAARMIDAGGLDGVDRIAALHVDPTRRAGTIGIRSGPMTAHCDTIQLTVRGRGGHAARPHESKDPIAAAAQLISSLYQFVSRATDSHDAVVVTVGCVRGGENPNVIPDSVELQGTMRTLDAVVRSRTIDHIRQVARGVGEITGTEIDVSLHASIPTVSNDAELTRLIASEAGDMLGTENVELITRPSMGSEDFACYLEHVPGAMFRLGSATDLAAVTRLHTSRFDIDERVLEIGAKLFVRIIVMACQPTYKRANHGYD